MSGREGRWAAVAALLTGMACQDPPCGEAIGDLCAVVGSGEIGWNGDGRLALETDLNLVSAARRGPDGLVWVMDFNNQRLRRVEADGRITTVCGNGEHAIAAVGAGALESPLENPLDFRFLPDGRLVFVSYHDPRVLEVSPEGRIVAIAGAAGGVTGTVGDEGDGGPASQALFIQLDGIAVASDGTIFVSDSRANRVRRIAAEGERVITTVAGTGDGALAGDGGPGIAAALRWPTALELGPDGALYIADALNHALRRLDADGTITTIAGDGVAGHEGDGGPASAARLDQPFGVAVDAEGAIYVADRGNHRVRRIGVDGMIETIAGTGAQGDGPDGPGRAAELRYVARIAIDGDDLLIADQSNGRVRRLRLR